MAIIEIEGLNSTQQVQSDLRVYLDNLIEKQNPKKIRVTRKPFNRVGEFENVEVMRKIVTRESKELDVSEINDSHIVGFVFNDGDKAQIIKIEPNNYVTHVVGDNNGHLMKHILPSIQSILRKNNVKEAFVFETREEFIKWLSE